LAAGDTIPEGAITSNVTGMLALKWPAALTVIDPAFMPAESPVGLAETVRVCGDAVEPVVGATEIQGCVEEAVKVAAAPALALIISMAAGGAGAAGSLLPVNSNAGGLPRNAVFSNILTPTVLVMARSSRPSPLKSPAAMEVACIPPMALGLPAAGLKVPEPSPSSTATVAPAA